MTEKTVRIAGFPVSVTVTESHVVAWHPETGSVTTADSERAAIRKMTSLLTRLFEFAAEHGRNPYVDKAYLKQ